MIKLNPGGQGHDKKAVFGRANHWDSERIGSGREQPGAVSEIRDVGRPLLQVEDEIRWDGRLRRAEMEPAPKRFLRVQKRPLPGSGSGRHSLNS